MVERVLCGEKKHVGGKLVKVCLLVQGTRVVGVVLTGDFFVEPEDTFERVLRSLLEVNCELSEVSSVVSTLLVGSGIKLHGITVDDVKEAIELALAKTAFS